MKKNNTQIETVEYYDHIYHAPLDYSTTQKKIDRAAEARDAIFDLLLDGKLDKTDIAIIEARNCSPMPSNRKIADQLKISHMTVKRRVLRIERLVTRTIPAQKPL